MEVIEHGPEISMPEIVGHRRNPPRPGVGLADRRMVRRNMLPQRALQHREPPRTQLACARVQLIVEARQVVAEGGREQGRRPFHRGELHSRRHQH